MPVEKQVTSSTPPPTGIWTMSRSTHVRRWESEFLGFLEAEHSKILKGFAPRRRWMTPPRPRSSPRSTGSRSSSRPTDGEGAAAQGADPLGPAIPGRSRGRWSWWPRPSSNVPRTASCPPGRIRRRSARSWPTWSLAELAEQFPLLRQPRVACPGRAQPGGRHSDHLQPRTRRCLQCQPDQGGAAPDRAARVGGADRTVGGHPLRLELSIRRRASLIRLALRHRRVRGRRSSASTACPAGPALGRRRWAGGATEIVGQRAR